MVSMENYIKIMNATPEERSEVEAWVKAGNDFHDNPFSLSSENGSPLDFISAISITQMLQEEEQSSLE